MKTYRDVGIPFKQRDLAEADRIISILTKFHGRVDAVVKGVRKITSRKGGNIDIMTLSKFSFARGTNLDIVTEVEQIHSFELLKQNLENTSSLFFICEMIDKIIHVGSSEKESFSLLLKFLSLSEQSKNALYLYAFTYKLLSQQGYSPNVTSCLICNVPFSEEDKRYIYDLHVGMICSKHRKTKQNPMSNNALKVLRFISSHTIEDCRQININSDLENELRLIFQSWIEGITENEMKSVTFIHKNKKK